MRGTTMNRPDTHDLWSKLRFRRNGAGVRSVRGELRASRSNDDNSDARKRSSYM